MISGFALLHIEAIWIHVCATQNFNSLKLLSVLSPNSVGKESHFHESCNEFKPGAVFTEVDRLKEGDGEAGVTMQYSRKLSPPQAWRELPSSLRNIAVVSSGAIVLDGNSQNQDWEGLRQKLPDLPPSLLCLSPSLTWATESKKQVGKQMWLYSWWITAPGC